MIPGSDFQRWSKVDLHRHLEGSLRTSTLLELAGEYGMLGEIDRQGLEQLVAVGPGDPFQPAFFLSRFETIRKFFVSREVIQRLAAEVIEDAAADRVRYLELRFTPAALASQHAFGLDQVSDWVISAAAEAALAHGIKVHYLLSINRHEPVEVAAEVAALAASLRARGVVGLDLAGDELRHSAQPFAGVVQQAREAGLRISVHAGEWGQVDELAMVIREFGAARVGHGVRVLEDPDLLREARERDVCFEISLTSNLRTGAVPGLDTHPLPEMLEAGLQVALTTDDPGIFGITLSDEYELAHELGLSAQTLKGMTLSAVGASFLEPKPKRELESRFITEFWGAGEVDG